MIKSKMVALIVVANLIVGGLGGGVTPTEVKGGPIVLTPEDFKTSDEVERETPPSLKNEMTSKQEQTNDNTSYLLQTQELSTHDLETETVQGQEKSEIKPTYDISRVDVQDRWWFYHNKIIAEEDKTKLENYKGNLSEVVNDNSVEAKVREFTKYLFDFNSKNYKDEKQIKEHAQKLKALYNKPIDQIEAGLKSKAESKVVCASSEPVFFGTYKNGEQVVLYSVVKRYKPTEQPSHKYGRYLLKVVLVNGIVQEYEVLEEVLELCRLWDTSDIPMTLNTGELDEERMPMDISEVDKLSIMSMDRLLKKYDYKRKSLSDEEFKKVDDLVRDLFLVMSQGNYNLYMDEVQKVYMSERVKQFGYDQEMAGIVVDNRMKEKEYSISSQGLISPKYAFYSEENLVIVFVFTMKYMADRDGLSTRYSFMIDEVQLERKDDSAYGYIVKNVLLSSVSS